MRKDCKSFLIFIGDDYDSTKVTLGGDQLTRVCFDSAKHLRGGSETPTQRLEQLHPVIEELFHVEQDLLEVINGILNPFPFTSD